MACPQQRRRQPGHTSSDNDFWFDLKTALSLHRRSGARGSNVILNAVSGVVLVKACRPGIAGRREPQRPQARGRAPGHAGNQDHQVSLNDSYQTGINWAKFSGHDQRWAGGVLAPGSSLSGGSTALSGSAVGQGIGSAITSTPGKAGAINSSWARVSSVWPSRGLRRPGLLPGNPGRPAGAVQPRIATLNNQKAVLKVGTDDYFVTNVTGLPPAPAAPAHHITTPTVTLQPFFGYRPGRHAADRRRRQHHPARPSAVTVVEERTKEINLGSQIGVFHCPGIEQHQRDRFHRPRPGRPHRRHRRPDEPGAVAQPQRPARPEPGAGGGYPVRPEGAANKKRELVILMKSTVIEKRNSWRQEWSATHERVQALDPRKIEWQTQ